MLLADDMSKELASSDSEYKGHISSVSFSTSLDESSLDATPLETPEQSSTKTGSENVADFMSLLLGTVMRKLFIKRNLFEYGAHYYFFRRKGKGNSGVTNGIE